MKLYIALAALLLAASAGASEPLKQAERSFAPDCKTITSGAARELFNISLATAAAAKQGQQFILLSSLDNVATNYVVISTWAASANAEGVPLPGMGPHKLEIGPNVKLFVRKGTATGATDVCAGAFR